MIKENRTKRYLASLILMFSLMLGACGSSDAYAKNQESLTSIEEASAQEINSNVNEITNALGSGELKYAGKAFEYVNGNVPAFSDEELTTEAFEKYSELDELGRCGMAYANICEELMPTEEREGIGMIKPSGWQTVKYQGLVDGNYLYNRCHLIGFQLAGENANEKNLITGTRYMNVDGMLPFENQVADFVKDTGYHVLYRVTPVYEGDELVARGVQIEAKSVEDKGAGLSFNVFVYNVQPGVIIDYVSGNSRLDENYDPLEAEQETKANEASHGETKESNGDIRYVLNVNSNKFHYPSCNSIKRMKQENRVDTSLSREILIERGFSPCGNCNP
ncbi:MAG: DNA/RNA non-specific endonuclease [Eubacteriales bacterium]|nr:DNA/RNA non-specific endonuclease [Eubacteriales bacterium]